ncbi:DNA/RNA helicase domain-containing protein [Streptomyces polygonati]|uniref:DNA/RNA helicase domain-containing protein n=1 Tax=Streptomyces polygonati TaxID=1617087 RepID=A0ABV8HX58_9ACTN
MAAEMHSGALDFHLQDRFSFVHGHQPNRGEVRSWQHSIPALMSALIEAGLDDVEVMLEYTLPLSSKRADAVIAGVHPETGEPSYVIVELKQWAEAYPDEEAPNLCRVPAMPGGAKLNPIEQVRGYCDYFARFNGALDGYEHRIGGVAYLHNATQFGAGALDAAGQSPLGRFFTGDERGKFIAYLQERLAPKPGARAADEFQAGRIKPSTQLIAVAAKEVREREQFQLLAEQQLAYELVLKSVRDSRRGNSKEVIVVTGGPGSGKSVIALSLLGELYRQGRSALHATGSQSFTTTMRKVAGARKREVQDLFKYFNSFMTAEPNDLDVLICDEAHRMRETSANRYTPAANRTGRAQVDELIDAARVPVFLLDQHQVVRPGEMGTVDEIRDAAAAKGLACQVVELDGQFRCGGSDAYVHWVERLLGLAVGGPVEWVPDKLMCLEVVDSPQELEAFLAKKQEDGYGARMSAGFCWRWSDAQPGEPLPTDVQIGDWARPWNLKGERSVMGAPPSAMWATDPAGFGQVGCIYTAQGFEYDWSGVILGPDLVWRDDHWVIDRTASKDPALIKKSVAASHVERLIRNTYKVLLTRGMIGTVIYSTDAETREKLRSLLPAAPAYATADGGR